MDLFKYIFPTKSTATSSGFGYDVERIIVSTLIGISFEELTDDERSLLKEYLQAKRLDEVLALFKTKYSKTEWENLLRREIEPLVKSYVDEVVFSDKS